MISLVVPIYNEQENLPEFRQRAVAALECTGRPWEIIFVNDGSRDRSGQLLDEFHRADARMKILTLSRNFGHQPAVTAGIHHARGDCVILIDGDLQDPPEVIPALINKWAEGFQVVVGQRASRMDRGVRGAGFRLFYPVLRYLTDLPNGADAGIFGLMDRAVVEQFNKLPERSRFIPGLRSWLGFRQAAVTYDRQERAAGKPKQTLRRLMRYAMDAMLSFSNKPLRIATYTGFIISLLAFLLGVWFLVTFFAFHKQSGSGFTTTIICVLFLGGVQLITIGILGEYLGRIYEEIKQRPLYIVQEAIGLDEAITPGTSSVARPATPSVSEPAPAELDADLHR
jgi:dolichol-phosphate mannosyltransferase